MLRKKSLLALLLSLCMVVGILPGDSVCCGAICARKIPAGRDTETRYMWDKPANAIRQHVS